MDNQQSRRLNFGCGSIQPLGWVNVDLLDFGQKYVGTTDMFGRNTFEIIVAHCTLQIVEYHDMPKILGELYRILDSDGVIRISLPDIVTGFKNYIKGNKKWFPNGESDIDMRLSAWLTWYSTTKTLLTQNALMQLLKQSGFKYIEEAAFKVSKLSDDKITELDTRENECYFIEAQK